MKRWRHAGIPVVDGHVHVNRFDRMTPCPGKMLPSLNREHMPRAPPNADRLSFDEQGARPDTRCPQRAALTLVGHQEFAVGAL